MKCLSKRVKRQFVISFMFPIERIILQKTLNMVNYYLARIQDFFPRGARKNVDCNQILTLTPLPSSPSFPLFFPLSPLLLLFFTRGGGGHVPPPPVFVPDYSVTIDLFSSSICDHDGVTLSYLHFLQSPVRGKVSAAVNDIRSGRHYQGMNKLYNHSLVGKRDIHKLARRIAQKEMKCLGAVDSILQSTSKTKEDFDRFSWNAVDNELEAICPLIFATLKGATEPIRRRDAGVMSSPKKVQTFKRNARRTRGVVTAVLANHKNKKLLTRFQKINSVRLWVSGCKRKVCNVMQSINQKKAPIFLKRL